MFFAGGACANRTKTVTVVEGGLDTIIETPGEAAAGGAKEAVTSAAKSGSLPGTDAVLYMDRQQDELQKVLVGSETIALKRDQNTLVLIFRSDAMFGFDSAIIKPGVQDEIRRIAEILYRYTETRIRIEGHTDSIGSVEFNQMLSERRADATKNELIARSLQFDRIQALGFGATMPVASNATPDGRQLNRRVQVFVIPVGERF